MYGLSTPKQSTIRPLLSSLSNGLKSKFLRETESQQQRKTPMQSLSKIPDGSDSYPWPAPQHPISHRINVVCLRNALSLSQRLLARLTSPSLNWQYCCQFRPPYGSAPCYPHYRYSPICIDNKGRVQARLCTQGLLVPAYRMHLPNTL